MIKRYLSLFFACCLLLTTLPFPSYATHPSERNKLTIMVKVSPEADFHSLLTIQIKHSLTKQILSCQRINIAQQPELPRAFLQVMDRTYVLDYDGHLYEPNAQAIISLSPSLYKEIEHWVRVVEQAHYGKPLNWSEVRKEFERYAYAEVVDMETGERFRVQRRAGSQHADVQTLTLQDTKIMKQIYNGEWSWKRRAILLKINGHTYAASMHGMPHGGGAIAGNGMRGHFCIHFNGSSTHKRPETDPSHSMMVQKAAGQLTQAIVQADPHKLVDYFLIALHEQDLPTLSMMTEPNALPFAAEDMEYSKETRNEKGNVERQAGMVGLFTAILPVNVTSIKKGDKKRRKADWMFVLKRSSPLERWKVTDVSIGDSGQKRADDGD